MKTTLCTLYNSLYLDKGLVLFDSLKECANDFELYVLCMDDKCYEVLSSIKDDRLKSLHLSDVENAAMLDAKSNRSIGEYCWTCSSRLIQYIFDTFNPECCTYIDSDLFFYNDPQILVDEMLAEGKSVMMVPHRFTDRNKKDAEKVGLFCVEFNCFRNTPQARIALDYWHKKCLECCSAIGDGIHWGDQKYMDEWPTRFPEIVHVCKHLGAGIAPWNIESYKKQKGSVTSVIDLESGKEIKNVFYHFQGITYITRGEINTGIPSNLKYVDYTFVNSIYEDYLKRIEEKKKMLESEYGISFIIKRHPAKSRPMWKTMLLKLPYVKRLIQSANHVLPSYIIHI